jgi:hypothetical protein
MPGLMAYKRVMDLEQIIRQHNPYTSSAAGEGTLMGEERYHVPFSMDPWLLFFENDPNSIAFARRKRPDLLN